MRFVSFGKMMNAYIFGFSNKSKLPYFNLQIMPDKLRLSFVEHNWFLIKFLKFLACQQKLQQTMIQRNFVSFSWNSR